MVAYNGLTTDTLSNKLYLDEVTHCNYMLKRIISIILMMASENIPFRKHPDKLFIKNNGKIKKYIYRIILKM